jgi:hypothetical protein
LGQEIERAEQIERAKESAMTKVISIQAGAEWSKDPETEFRFIEDVLPGMEIYTIWNTWEKVVSVSPAGQFTWLLHEDGTTTEDRNGEMYEARWPKV